MNIPIAIVGPSGSGKSSSLRNLPADDTLILNIERKPLPFREALRFGQRNVLIKDIPEWNIQLEKAINGPEKNLAIESGTKYFEMLLAQSKTINKGYDIYNFYNDRIGQLLEKLKGTDKFVYFLAIDERLEMISPNGSTTTSRRIKVGGKQWEGMIEKEFTIVLFTDVVQSKDGKIEHKFVTNNDGTSSAKSPDGMFPLKIDNDLALVRQKVNEYYGIKEVKFDLKDATPSPVTSPVAK